MTATVIVCIVIGLAFVVLLWPKHTSPPVAPPVTPPVVPPPIVPPPVATPPVVVPVTPPVVPPVVMPPITVAPPTVIPPVVVMPPVIIPVTPPVPQVPPEVPPVLPPVAPPPPSARTPAQRMLAYLTALPSQADHRCILGQFLETVAGAEFTKIDALTASTGKTVGLIGMPLTYDLGSTMAMAKGIWQTRRALITGLILFKNPVTGGSFSDTTPALHATVTAGTAAHTNFFGTQLPAVADRLQGIKAAIPGVVMLIRTLHELNGNWFWWTVGGPSGATDLIALQRQVHDYLVNTAGLGDMLIFDYNAYAGINNNETIYYPGAAYADVVSFDYYGNSPGIVPVSTYNRLLALGKPIHWAEFGPVSANPPPASHVFDETILLNAVKNTCPKVFAVSCWTLGWSWVQQNNFATLMNDPVIATAADVHANTR